MSEALAIPHLQTRRSAQRGATFVEFTLSILVVFFLVFWIWEMVMLVYTYGVLSDAAKEGVRYAIVHGSRTGTGNCSGPGCTDASGTNVTNVVKDYASYSLHDISAISVTVNYYDPLPPTAAISTDQGVLVVVAVNYSYLPWLRLPWNPPTLKTGAQGRIVW